MMLDQQNVLSDAQAVTATANSTNTIDLGAVGSGPYGITPISDVGRAFHGKVLAQVVEDFAGLTSVQVLLVTSDTANLASPTTVYETAVIPLATLKAGYQFRMDSIPPGITQRYLGLRYIVVGAGTAGKITGTIVWDKQTNQQVL